MEDNDNVIGRAITAVLVILLFYIFLTLKLCHVIDWSWWLVCAPMYQIIIMKITEDI